LKLTSAEPRFSETVTWDWKQRRKKWPQRNDPPPSPEAVLAGVLRRVSKSSAALLRAARLLKWEGSWWEGGAVWLAAPFSVANQFAENARLRAEVESAFAAVLGYSGGCFLWWKPLAPPVPLPTLSPAEAKTAFASVIALVDRPIASLLRAMRVFNIASGVVRLQTNDFVRQQFTQGTEGRQRRALVEAAFTKVLGYPCVLEIESAPARRPPAEISESGLLATALDLGGVVVAEADLTVAAPPPPPDQAAPAAEKPQLTSVPTPGSQPEMPSLLDTALDLGGEVVDDRAGE
jgi:hypothetical protein